MSKVEDLQERLAEAEHQIHKGNFMKFSKHAFYDKILFHVAKIIQSSQSQIQVL